MYAQAAGCSAESHFPQCSQPSIPTGADAEPGVKILLSPASFLTDNTLLGSAGLPLKNSAPLASAQPCYSVELLSAMHASC